MSLTSKSKSFVSNSYNEQSIKSVRRYSCFSSCNYCDIRESRKNESVVKTNRTKTRLNVILLTHISSGSTIVENMFNLHPDVFYIYEPLNTLRRDIDTNGWRALQMPSNDAYKQDFLTLLRDLFTCGFDEERTIELAFPKWVRDLNAWYNSSTITVTKIMQTRLPREGGIRELEQVCRSDPIKFDCLIVHLVRDPRAVLSSLIPRRFFMKGPVANLFTQTPMSPEGIKLLKENAQTLYALVSENLDYVLAEWSNWFKRRYILVRYEDIISNIPKEVFDIYKYFGLPMVDIITNWIKGIPPPGRDTSRYLALVISKTDTASIEKWRFRQKPSLISSFEEACSPLMKTVGYISVNGSENLQHDKSKPLRTAKIPFLTGLRVQEPA
ncbi:carbohydrate sulfotransferase 3-like [Orbicella faveolata]|uniref:carbohydrate sulfotransferase 3-like n=1 Tax=Orbicella faveolata TaxID=48498 RepID=UPI0009E2D702|nr:carbohydrate sulfotransferase 3-like [Orbicella faveolata]